RPGARDDHLRQGYPGQHDSHDHWSDRRGQLAQAALRGPLGRRRAGGLGVGVDHPRLGADGRPERVGTTVEFLLIPVNAARLRFGETASEVMVTTARVTSSAYSGCPSP